MYKKEEKGMFSSGNNTVNMDKFFKLEGQLIRRQVKGFMKLSADKTEFYMDMDTKHERVTMEDGREVIIIENKRGIIYITSYEGKSYVCTIRDATKAAFILLKNGVNELAAALKP